MNKREPLLTDAYFDDTIEANQEEISFYQTALRQPQEGMKVELGYSILFGFHYENLFLKYSRGYPVTELQTDLLAALDALEAYKRHPQAEDFFFNGEQDEYMQAVALLSLGLLLKVEQDVFGRLVDAIGLRGQDYVLEWLAGRRLAQRPQTTALLFPKTYARLRDALQAPRDITPPLLKSFLANWYESVDTVWYNIHAHRQDAAGFTGYWCWEAAAAAWAMQVDDAELQPMRYYPKDLADFAFGRQPQPA